MDYVVYGGGEQIASAFRAVALFFNHGAMKGIMATFLTGGIGYALFSGGIGGLIARLENKDNSPGFVAIAWALFGLSIFSAGVLVKTTVHVYDQSKNAYFPVGNVPLLLGWTAGGFNSLEVAYRDMVGASSGTQPMNENGSPFKLIYEATSDYRASDINYYLHQNISEYYKRCLVPSKPDMNVLNNGTDDLLTELNNAAKPGWFVDWRSSSNPEGSLTTCQDAYLKMKADLAPSSPSMLKKLDSVCKSSDFDVSNAQQKNACATQLSQAVNLVYGSSGGWQLLFTNSIVANGIRDAMMSEGLEGAMKALVNRSMMNEGLSANVASDTWMPLVKAIVTSIVIALATVLFPLFVTPLFLKALKLFIGMMFFVVTWNIADIIITTMFLPTTLSNALNEAAQNRMGLAAMWLSPSSNMKALALLGEARTSGMNIAVLLTASLAGVSAYGLTSFGQRMTASLDKNSDKAADETQPERSGALLSAMADSQGQFKAIAAHGLDAFSNAREFDMIENAKAVEAKVDGGNVSASASSYGEMKGGGDRGQLGAVTENAVNQGNSIAEQSAITASVSEGERQGHANTMSQLSALEGISVSSYASNTSEIAEFKNQGDKKAIKDEAVSNGVDTNTQAFNTGYVASSKEQGSNRPYIEKGNVNSKHASSDSEKQSQDVVSDIKAKDRIINTVLANNPGSTQEDARDDLARRNHSATFADVVVNENSLGSEKTAFIEASERKGSADGKLETLKNNDIGIQELAKEQARIQTNEIIGQTEVSEHKTDTQLQNIGKDHLSQSSSSAEEKSKTDGGIETFNAQSAEKNIQQEAGHNAIWNALKKTDRSPEELGLDFAGANTHTALTPNNVDDYFAAGLIDQKQWQTVHENGGGRLDWSVGLNDDGTLNSMTTRVATGDSASENNSYSVDKSTVLKMNAETGDVNSTREVLSDPVMVASIYKQEHGEQVLADRAASVMSSLLTENTTVQSSGSAGGSLGLGKGSKGGPGGQGGGNASVGLSGNYSVTDTENYETQRGAFSKFVGVLEKDADRKGLKDHEKDMFVAEHFSGFFRTQIDRASMESQDRGSHNEVFKDSQEYAKANGIQVPHRGHSDPEYKPSVDKAAKEQGFRHPQQYQHEYEKARLTQYSPSNTPTAATGGTALPQSEQLVTNANAANGPAEVQQSSATGGLSDGDMDRILQKFQTLNQTSTFDQGSKNVVIQRSSKPDDESEKPLPNDNVGSSGSGDAPPMKSSSSSNKLPN